MAENYFPYSNSLSPDNSQATKWKAVRESINTGDAVLYQLVRSIELACEGLITGHVLFNQFQKGYSSIDVMVAFKKLYYTPDHQRNRNDGILYQSR